MQVREREGELRKVVEHFPFVEEPMLALSFDSACQVSASSKLHADAQGATGAKRVSVPNYVRVPELPKHEHLGHGCLALCLVHGANSNLFQHKLRHVHAHSLLHQPRLAKRPCTNKFDFAVPFPL